MATPPQDDSSIDRSHLSLTDDARDHGRRFEIRLLPHVPEHSLSLLLGTRRTSSYSSTTLTGGRGSGFSSNCRRSARTRLSTAPGSSNASCTTSCTTARTSSSTSEMLSCQSERRGWDETGRTTGKGDRTNGSRILAERYRSGRLNRSACGSSGCSRRLGSGGGRREAGDASQPVVQTIGRA